MINLKPFLPFLTFFAIFLIPRVIGLGWDEWNVDAQRWMIRSDLFIKNLSNGDFPGLFQSYHPGITLMWLSGTSKAVFYWLFEQMAGYSPKLSSGFVYPEQFYLTSFVAKFPLVFVISLLLTYSILLLKKLGINKTHLIFFALFLSLEPFYLGITRYFHLSGLESAFVFASFTSALYGSYNKKLRYIIFSGFFLASAFFTKSSGIVLLPALGILIFATHLFQSNFKESVIPTIKYFSILIVSAIASLFILMPLMWIDPVNTIKKIFELGVEGKGFTDGPHASILQYKVTYYFELFFVKSLGLTFISFVVGIPLFLKEKNRTYKYVLSVAMVYVFYYFLVMSIPSKQMTRYTSLVYPFAILVSSYSIYRLFEWVNKYKYGQKFLILIIGLYYLVSLQMFYPNFSAFHTDLLGWMPGYSKIRKPYNDGEFYLQVAQYINSDENINPRETVLVVTEGNKDVSASFGFLGTTYSGEIKEKDKKYSHLFYATDYTDTEDFPEGCEKVKELGPRWPGKFGFVYVFKCK